MHHSSGQHWILNLWSEARIKPSSSWILVRLLLSQNRNPYAGILNVTKCIYGHRSVRKINSQTTKYKSSGLCLEKRLEQHNNVTNGQNWIINNSYFLFVLLIFSRLSTMIAFLIISIFLSEKMRNTYSGHSSLHIGKTGTRSSPKVKFRASYHFRSRATLGSSGSGPRWWRQSCLPGPTWPHWEDLEVGEARRKQNHVRVSHKILEAGCPPSAQRKVPRSQLSRN